MKRLGSWSAQGEQPRRAAASLPGLRVLGMGTKSGVRDGEEACEGSACFYGCVAIVSSVTGPRSRALAERLMTLEEGPSPAFLTSPLLLCCPWGAAAAPRLWEVYAVRGTGWKRGAASATSSPVSVRLSVHLCGLCHGPDLLVGAKLSHPACFLLGPLTASPRHPLRAAVWAAKCLIPQVAPGGMHTSTGHSLCSLPLVPF